MLKKTRDYVIFLFVLVITMIVLLSKIDWERTISVIKGANIQFIILAVICMFVAWMLEAFTIWNLIRNVHSKISYITALKLQFVGIFYCYITPFASGGQPAQLIKLSNYGIKPTKSTAALVSKFLIFQFSVTTLSIIVVLFRLPSILSVIERSKVFVLTGFIVNLFILIAMIAIAFNAKSFLKLANHILKILNKIHIVKSYDRAKYKTQKFVHDFHRNLRVMFNNPIKSMSLMLVEMSRMLLIFSISYLVYRAFSLDEIEWLDMVALQSIHFVAVSFIPSPGTVGSSEAGFYLIFRDIFSLKYLAPALILWRTITYYFGLMLAGVLHIVFELIDRKKYIQKDSFESKEV